MKICRVSTFKSCTPSLCEAGKVWHQKLWSVRQSNHRFGCCPTLRLPSHYPLLWPATAEYITKGQDHSTGISGTNAWRDVYSTHYSQKAWHIWWLNAAADNPTFLHKAINWEQTASTPPCFFADSPAIIDICSQRTCISQEQCNQPPPQRFPLTWRTHLRVNNHFFSHDKKYGKEILFRLTFLVTPCWLTRVREKSEVYLAMLGTHIRSNKRILY